MDYCDIHRSRSDYEGQRIPSDLGSMFVWESLIDNRKSLFESNYISFSAVQKFRVRIIAVNSATISLKPFSRQALVFTCLQYKFFEKAVGKGEIARNEQFLLFPQRFLPLCRTFHHFHGI